jgi:hypothetical protein
VYPTPCSRYCPALADFRAGRPTAFLVTFTYAAGLSYLKQTDGNFAYLDPARFLPSSLEGCADHACDAGR